MDLPINDKDQQSRMVHARQALCVVVAGWLCWEYWLAAGDLFQWHPICMTVGYVVMMVEGLSLGRRVSKARGLVERKGLINDHMWVFTVALVLVGVGFGVIYRSKELRGKAHLTSWHGLIGAIAGVLFLLQSSLGFFLYYQLAAKLNLSSSIRSALRPLHLYLAILSSVTGIAAFSLGMASNYALIKFPLWARVVFGAVAAILHCLSFSRI